MNSAGGARPHRPALFSDLTELIDAAGGTSPSSRAEIAAATAAAVVEAGRTAGAERDTDDGFVSLADRVGLETLAALWRDSEPASLPGALWTLYVLRQWCHCDGAGVTRLWRSGEPLAPADAVVAGVVDYPDASAVEQLADAVLAGVYRGDLAVALERAAAFFRVVAAGRRSLADSDSASASASDDALTRAERNERAAASLTLAAARWRADSLH